MRVLMLAMSDVVSDVRIRREAAALANAGMSVHIIGKDPGSSPAAEWPDRVTVEWAATSSPLRGRGRSPGRLDPRRAARWGLLPTHRRAVRASYLRQARALALHWPADVVHAHDFPTLPLAAELATWHGARLVYDAHECWLGRRREERPTPLEDAATRRQEARLGGQADVVLTVGEGLAAWFRRRYGWRHLTVVRNSFPSLDAAPPASVPSGLLYAGRVAAGRDLLTIARAAPQLAPLRVVLVGPQDRHFAASLPTGSLALGDALPVEALDGLLHSAGLALVTLEDGWENHRLALPNKLFQAVRAGVPVVASDLPELRRVVASHGLGTLYRPGSPSSLAAAVREACDRYPELVRNVAAARPALSWERDEASLLEVYERLAKAGAGVST